MADGILSSILIMLVCPDQTPRVVFSVYLCPYLRPESTLVVRAGAFHVHGVEWRHREHGRQGPRPLVSGLCCSPRRRVGDDAASDDPDQKLHRHGSCGDVDFLNSLSSFCPNALWAVIG